MPPQKKIHGFFHSFNSIILVLGDHTSNVSIGLAEGRMYQEKRWIPRNAKEKSSSKVNEEKDSVSISFILKDSVSISVIIVSSILYML